jgi:hypothetical protein
VGLLCLLFLCEAVDPVKVAFVGAPLLAFVNEVKVYYVQATLLDHFFDMLVLLVVEVA